MLEYIRFYDTFQFFQISKNFGLYNFFFLKIYFFLFWGENLKILKFRDSRFVEPVILHLYWSVYAVCFKIIFLANFLTRLGPGGNPNHRSPGGVFSPPCLTP